MINFMNNIDIKKANVVGHHVGGKVGLELAINWPERVNKLVLSSVGYFPNPDEGIVINDPVKDMDFTSRVEIKPEGSHLMEWWRRSACWGNPLDIVEERFIEYVKAGPRGEEIHWAGGHHDAKIRFPLINCPTLVLSASQDPMSVVAEGVKRLIPRSELIFIENGPIDIDRVMPKEFAEAILRFLGS
jgi:pimeloyl-ACP methyl ester carboxylesterase